MASHSFHARLLLAILFLLAFQVQTQAQDIQLEISSDLLNRIEQLERQMVEQRQHRHNRPQVCRDFSCGYYIAYENVLVKPFFSRNDAFSINDAVGAANSADVRGFDWDVEYSPRVEFGHYSACGCIGWRGRYWQFDQSTSESIQNGIVSIGISDDPDVNLDQAVTSLVASHSLALDVFDLEATSRRGNLIYSGGLRYARLDHSYVAIVDGGGFNDIRSSHFFEGIGPTVSLEFRQSIGKSRWNALGTTRGSILFGDSGYQANQQGEVLRRSSGGDLLPVGEIQLGLEWMRRLSKRGTFVFRVATEGQIWVNGGSAHVEHNGQGSDDFDNDPQSTDMGFLGLNVTTGFIY